MEKRKGFFKIMFSTVMLISILTLSFFGVTYAWTNNLFENSSDKDKVNVLYIDGSFINATCSKESNKVYEREFCINNNGLTDIFYNLKIKIDNLSYEEIADFFNYELYDITNNVSLTGVKSLSHITSPSEIILLNNSIIGKNEKQEYVFKLFCNKEVVGTDENGSISLHIVVD